MSGPVRQLDRGGGSVVPLVDPVDRSCRVSSRRMPCWRATRVLSISGLGRRGLAPNGRDTAWLARCVGSALDCPARPSADAAVRL